MGKGRYALPFLGVEILEVDAPFHRTKDYLVHCRDFFLPQGTPIRATRAGVVVERESRYSRSYRSRRYVARGNHVIVRHADWEESVYAHVMWRSVKVRKGQRVRKGQILALSGQTGVAWYPHPHFGVYDIGGDNIKADFGRRFKKISVKRALKLARSS